MNNTNTLGELYKQRQDISDLIDEVSDKVEDLLNKGVTPVKERRQLNSAQLLFAKIQGDIDTILQAKK